MSHLPRHVLEGAIAQVDARLALEPGAFNLRFDRAQFLELLGRKDEAQSEYIGVLQKWPGHVESLNALGLLLLGAGDRARARILFGRALAQNAHHATANANLAYLDVLDGDFPAARALYENALRADPTLAAAHHGLGEIAERQGDHQVAAGHRALGLRYRPITIHRFTGTGRPIHILALGSATSGNVVTERFFDSRVFLVASVVVEYLDPATPLPPHDLVFNRISEADLCPGPLAAAADILHRTNAPVINHPRAVLATGRAENARRLGRLAGVVTPRVEHFARADLIGSGAAERLSQRGFGWPLLIRSPGYHTGEHFVKIDIPSRLDSAIASLPGDELLVIEYLDVRDTAGNAHKYRVIIVDGQLYPLHHAISRDWKVHYFSADMADHAEHRAHDEAFLHDMKGTIGGSAVAALGGIRDALALQYGGIDFALDPHANVIVFEANASMIVPSPDADAKWDYRRAPVARIDAAVREMLVSRTRAEA